MELKVWVDGIQRVVCGATFDTTCQDVVIALAHAMGRTGRFTLIEKWRDVDRPLAPTECPLTVLYKWGEYAAEVRFILCQAHSDQQRKPQEKDRSWKKAGDKSLFSHNFSPQHVGLAGGGDASVKRSLTFSGAHNCPSDSRMSLSSSAPTSKFRKTHLGPVPNGDVRTAAPLPQTSRQLPASRPPGVASAGSSGGQQLKPSGPPAPVQPQQHPVPHPRHKRLSPAPPQGRDSLRNSGSTGPPSSAAAPSPSSSALTPGHQQSFSNTNRVSPVQPPIAQSRAHLHPHAQSGAQPFLQAHHQGPLQNREQAHRETHSLPRSRDSTPPPLPSSLPPDVFPRTQHSQSPVQEHQNTLAAVEASLDSADHSRQASLEIEEYDLDRNFPDVSRDTNRGERPSVSLEYRLDEGVASGSGGGHLEGEHAKLVRLVNMQQERLKTQESQIGMINTEITALEEREKEYEEQLQVIMEELLLQENRQHDLEPQLADLEGVEWENVLDGEKKCERDLSQQIEVYKAKIAEHEQKLEQIQEREKELHAEIRLEEERLASEQQQLQAEERKAAEEATKLREEITKLKAESAELEKKVSHGQTSLSSMDEELKTAEVDLAKKVSELEEMEKELKKENMKDFTANPVPVEAPRPKDSGETILKILEGRLSPRPPTVPSKGPDSPTTPPFITALASKTPSGVWV